MEGKPPQDGRMRLMQFEELSSASLRLRAPSLDDADAVYDEYAADPEVPRYMTWTPHKNRETVVEFVQGALERNRTGAEYHWAITRPAEDRLIGMISARIGGHMCDIGYVLGRKYWGRGYMTEAVTALSDWILADPDFYRVWAVCDVDNAASARVLEKSGFEKEGVLHRYMMHPNQSSEPRDCLAYARVR